MLESSNLKKFIFWYQFLVSFIALVFLSGMVIFYFWSAGFLIMLFIWGAITAPINLLGLINTWLLYKSNKWGIRLTYLWLILQIFSITILSAPESIGVYWFADIGAYTSYEIAFTFSNPILFKFITSSGPYLVVGAKLAYVVLGINLVAIVLLHLWYSAHKKSR